MLRFPNSPTTAKTRSASTMSSSSSDSDSDSSDSSIYREEDDFHSIESEEPIEFDYINNHSPHTTRDPIYPAHVCMVGPTAATSSAERQAIQVSQEAWDRAKDTVNRSVVMPGDAS